MESARTTNRHKRQGGFTIIELLIVIVIIAILVGLLVPVAGGAIKRTRIAGVKIEISQLEAAIAKFKADHDIEPPSSITLYELPAGWGSDTSSTSLIRQIWPQFNFLQQRDLNGDTTFGGSYTLTGGECLVFFLGGMFTKTTNAGSTTFSMVGFSKDPTNPLALGGSREAPLFEFRSERLTDVDNDGIPEFKDGLPSQRSPYLYYSSYDGQGYNALEFLSSPAVAPVTYGLLAPYRQGLSLSDSAWKPHNYQIISPGYNGTAGLDGAYGFGGPYLATGTDPLPLGTTPPNGLTLPAYGKLRDQEADNITNFSQGELRP